MGDTSTVLEHEGSLPRLLCRLPFVDSNLNDAFHPNDLPNHNICSNRNNPDGATCGATGPTSPADCTNWFLQLWFDQLPWIAERLNGSQSDWRIVVTHYPPQYRQDDWAQLASENEIDLIVTGHRHEQQVSNRDPAIGGAAWVVSGGGGGITSEGLPRVDGNDDQYGFFDVTISKSAIKLEGISHGGVLRSTTVIASRVTPTTTTNTTTSTNTDRDRNDDIVDDHPYSYAHPHSDIQISTWWKAPRQHRWVFIFECSHSFFSLQLEFALGVARYSMLLPVCVLAPAVMSQSSRFLRGLERKLYFFVEWL